MTLENSPSLLLLKKYRLEVLEMFLPAHFFYGGRVKTDNAAGHEGTGPGAGRRHPEGPQEAAQTPNLEGFIFANLDLLVGLQVDELNLKQSQYCHGVPARHYFKLE